MKIVLQDLGNGSLEVAEVPVPQVGARQVLIQGRCSLISPGTERMLMAFGRASLIGKARQQPERVRQTINKMKTDGIFATVEAVRSKLSEPIPLGYSHVGVVAECGDRETAMVFPIGTRVVSNGFHGDYTVASRTLVASIPDDVNDETASFTVLGAIALQGIRLLDPTLGETIFVMGLGPVGLLSVQLLKANGCRVLASDYDSNRLRLAEAFGAETCDLNAVSPVEFALSKSNGVGVDGVLVAAATESNEPLHHAALMSRQRGRVVLTGVTGMQLDRTEFFKRELTFQVSSSYGFGRYDEAYQTGAIDYPLGHIRWTAQRNFQAVLMMMSEGKLDPTPLFSDSFPIDQAKTAYEKLDDKDSLGILLVYTQDTRKLVDQRTIQHTQQKLNKAPGLGLIGCGQFARRMLLPYLTKDPWRRVSVASAGGISAARVAKEFGFSESTTDTNGIIADDRIDTLVISTNHGSHGQLVAQGLRANKRIYVEKPLATSLEDLAEVHRAWSDTDGFLMVGYNRRFAPHMTSFKAKLSSQPGPGIFQYTINAGPTPEKGWQSREGGRIIGEVCHFVDLLMYLSGSTWKHLSAHRVYTDHHPSETTAITMTFENGWVGTIHYVSGGPARLPKERLHIIVGTLSLECVNFKEIIETTSKGRSVSRSMKQDKGHREEMRTFYQSAKTGTQPVSIDDLFDVTLATFAALEAITTGGTQQRDSWRNQLWEASAAKLKSSP